jgi:hypothetical protein
MMPTLDVEVVRPSRIVITCDWDEVPHLDDVHKAAIVASTPPYQRDARSKGHSLAWGRRHLSDPRE